VTVCCDECGAAVAIASYSVPRAGVLYVARPVQRTGTMRDRRRLMLLGTLVGGLLLASCGAAAPPLPPTVILLIGALTVAGLGGLAAGCRGDRGAAGRNMDDGGDAGDPGGDAGDAGSDSFPGCGLGTRPLSAEAPSGWFRCCLGTEVRLCPPVPPNVACNYGLGQTICSDGVTCGFTWNNPCGTADAGADGTAEDAAADATISTGDAGVGTDASRDVFGGCGSRRRALDAYEPGWTQCCVGSTTMLCEIPPPGTECNYGAATFCPGGTCIPSFGAACGDAGSDAAETGP
jgi:hypothetical protein